MFELKGKPVVIIEVSIGILGFNDTIGIEYETVTGCPALERVTSPVVTSRTAMPQVINVARSTWLEYRFLQVQTQIALGWTEAVGPFACHGLSVIRRAFP